MKFKIKGTILEEEDLLHIEMEDIKESKRKDIWKILPKKQVLRKGHIRVTKHGVEYVNPHLHPYPYKIKEPIKKEKISKKELEKADRELKNKLREEGLHELMACYV